MKNLALTPVHETGHAIDLFLSGEKGRYSSEIEGTLPNKIYKKLLNTESGRFLKDTGLAYYIQPEEIFARGYAQFIAELTQKSEYMREVSDMSNLDICRQWPEEEFKEAIP